MTLNRAPRSVEPLPQRVTAAAALPVGVVAVPATVDYSPVPEDQPFVAPQIAPLEPAARSRPDMAELPPRIAARPAPGAALRDDLAPATLAVESGRMARPVRERRGTDAFAHRYRALIRQPEQVTAIDLGLDYLARVQLSDGRWRFDRLRNVVGSSGSIGSSRADAAATGLALLAFLGAGHDHFEGRHRFVVEDGLDFLTRTQLANGAFFYGDRAPADDGLLNGPISEFYSHGIATLALCEAFGMTGDPQLREPAQRALDYLAASQDADAFAAGNRTAEGSDYAVVAWQLAALRSGQLAGMSVESDVFSLMKERLSVARSLAPQPGADRWPASAPASDRVPTYQKPTVQTAVGLAMDLHLGSRPGDERLRSAADHVRAHPPEVARSTGATVAGSAESPERDNYYWYFGTEAMFYLGGDNWRDWSQRLFPPLIEAQVRSGPHAGSWQPLSHEHGAASDRGGRLYLTAMNLLSLEIEQRHLPADRVAMRRNAEASEKSTPHAAADGLQSD